MLRDAGPCDRLPVIGDHISVVWPDGEEEIFQPLKYPHARLSWCANLEELAKYGLRGSSFSDSLFWDVVDDIYASSHAPLGDQSRMLGVALLTKHEVHLMEKVLLSLRKVLDENPHEPRLIVASKGWIPVRRFARELIRQMIRDDLVDYCGLPEWREVRKRAARILEIFPDPLDYKPLDLF